MEKPNFEEFADAMLDIAWQGGDADGATIQELAEKHGLLKETEVAESCGENCVCAEVSDFPLNCYRKTY